MKQPKDDESKRRFKEALERKKTNSVELNNNPSKREKLINKESSREKPKIFRRKST